LKIEEQAFSHAAKLFHFRFMFFALFGFLACELSA